MDRGRVLDVIAERLGHWSVEREPDAVLVRNFDLRITCRIHEERSERSETASCALVTATHPSLPRPHVQHCAGWGDDDDVRADRAASAWLEGTFEVLHDLVCNPEVNEKVERGRMLVRNEETGERRAFRAILGPIEMLASANVAPRIAPRAAFLGVLVGPIGPWLADGGLHWLRCYVGRIRDQPPAIDCWFDNEPWPEGAFHLARLREDWGAPDGFEGLRQSIVFKPLPKDELPPMLAETLPAPSLAQRLRWWWRGGDR